MTIYAELGIRRVVNGNATLTVLGGSILAPGVAEAMADAGRWFVDLRALQAAVGAEIARLTGNEACYVPSGAAAGLTLVTAACMAGEDAALRERLPATAGMRSEIIVHRHTRVGYDFAVRMTGATLVEIGGPGGTSAAELEAALTPRTAAFFYFPRGLEERGELPLEEAVAICRPRGIRVIVDAAAQLPPRSNLWSFTRRGADAAIFSGGKALRGPQSTGLVLGREELIRACAFHGAPNAFIGRGMKVGKEELCGLLAAVRWYLAQDEAAELAWYEEAVRRVIAAVEGLPGVSASRVWPSEAGQPVPRARVELEPGRARRTRAELQERLRAGNPVVDLADGPGESVLVNPQTLDEADLEHVAARLREELAP